MKVEKRKVGREGGGERSEETGGREREWRTEGWRQRGIEEGFMEELLKEKGGP